MRGSRLPKGSWNTTCTSRRSAAHAVAGPGCRSRSPRQSILPDAAGRSRAPRERASTCRNRIRRPCPGCRPHRYRRSRRPAPRARRCAPNSRGAAAAGSARTRSSHLQQRFAHARGLPLQRGDDTRLRGRRPACAAGGATSRHASAAKSQRGANGQPATISPGRGGCPSMVGRRAVASRVKPRHRRQQPAVYGMAPARRTMCRPAPTPRAGPHTSRPRDRRGRRRRRGRG